MVVFHASLRLESGSVRKRKLRFLKVFLQAVRHLFCPRYCWADCALVVEDTHLTCGPADKARGSGTRPWIYKLPCVLARSEFCSSLTPGFHQPQLAPRSYHESRSVSTSLLPAVKVGNGGTPREGPSSRGVRHRRLSLSKQHRSSGNVLLFL